MKIEPEILRNRDDLEDIHKELLRRYDWYLIRDLDYLKNKNNLRIFYLRQEKIYCVITGNDLKKIAKKKARKYQDNFIFGDKKNEQKMDTADGTY